MIETMVFMFSIERKVPVEDEIDTVNLKKLFVALINGIEKTRAKGIQYLLNRFVHDFNFELHLFSGKVDTLVSLNFEGEIPFVEHEGLLILQYYRSYRG